MDLGSQPEPNLSLDLHTRASPRSPITDNSISLQTDPTLCDATRSTTPLHLFDHQSESHRAPDNDPDAAPLENSDDEGHAEEEQISILNYTMSIKKRQQRDDSTYSSCPPSHHSKRPAVEPLPSLPPPNLESRRTAVRSWGNLPLSISDPDVFEIMEKEKQRQVRGIELVTSENFVCLSPNPSPIVSTARLPPPVAICLDAATYHRIRRSNIVHKGPRVGMKSKKKKK